MAILLESLLAKDPIATNCPIVFIGNERNIKVYLMNINEHMGSYTTNNTFTLVRFN